MCRGGRALVHIAHVRPCSCPLQLHEQDEAYGVWVWDAVSANGTITPYVQ